MQQVEWGEKSRLPSETFLSDTFLDDIISEAPDMETAHKRQSQLQNAMNSCGVTLHKWCSNSSELLNNFLSSLRVFFSVLGLPYLLRR
ncbi:hypothetical protein TNCT_275771 [Trichonephila clavata]|uniref:Uncharacterized protein n=1 Tax=Trichonephila clavata TaxID=2740835 RepID=A0A8X6L9E8_TRICU|nr:hypothetical protein TNCT_275771 [Trichonephila clavata]